MGFLKWVGGATPVAQVDELIITGTPADSETITYTITDENNVAHVVITTLSSPSDIEAARDQVHAVLIASGDVEFLKVTWAKVDTDTITGTAIDDGRPFWLVVTESMGSGAVTDNDNGDGNSVLSAGPNSWAALANYETTSGGAGTVPVANDDLMIAEGSDSILYGLVTGIALSTLRKNPNHTGSVGDPVGDAAGSPYPLRVDVNGSGAKKLSINASAGGAFIWRGTCPDVLITGSLGQGLQIYLAGDVDNCRIIGPSVNGTIRFENSMTIDNVFVASIRGAVLELGSSLQSFDLLEADSGSIFCATNPAALTVGGTAVIELSGIEDWTGDVRNDGARILYTGEGDQNTPGEWFQKSGSTTIRPKTQIALFDVTILGGNFSDAEAVTEVTYNGTVTNYGGAAGVHVTGENVNQE